MKRSSLLLSPLAAAVLAGTGAAQVPIAGSLSDGTTGPLQTGVVYHATSSISIDAGDTLTAQPGAIVKFVGVGSQFTIRGDLLCQGTSGSPVIFTDVKDDSAGGDTNGDGPSVGLPGHYRGILFYTTSAPSVLDHTQVRFAGHSSYGGIHIFQSGADITVTNSSVSDCAAAGVDLSNLDAHPVFSGCSFDRNDLAVDDARLGAIPGFTNNTATGNNANYIRIVRARPTSDVTVTAASCLEGALVYSTSVFIDPGITVTLEQGVINKARTAGLRWETAGTLLVNGTAANPVVFTDLADDDWAGDTNNDGPSAGTPGHWRGLVFMAGSDASTVNRAVIRYGGSATTGGIDIQGDTHFTVTNTTVSDCSYDGIDFHGKAAFPTITGCTFERNSIAIDSVMLESIPGITNNSASGNLKDYIRVKDGSPTFDVTIEAESCLEGALVIDKTVVIPAGVRVTLGEGVVWKWELDGGQVIVRGAFDTNGTRENPVVLTDYRDDTWAGDTNGDGSATVPARDWWRGLLFEASPDSSLVQNALVRYVGDLNTPGIEVDSQNVKLQFVRVEHATNEGFEIRDYNGWGVNWTAYDCGDQGIELLGGVIDLRHVTTVGNDVGLERLPAHSGQVFDAISWGNATANYVGFSGGTQLFYSDGDPSHAGANGCIDADPQFLDLAGGDLRLDGLSPCIDTGDPLGGLDPDGTRGDMGAYSFDHCGPFTYCTPKPDKLGCAGAISFTGAATLPSSGPFLIEVPEVQNNRVGHFFYSVNGRNDFPFRGGTICVGWGFGYRRTPVVSSGGNLPPTADCSGSFSFDFNDWMQAGKDPNLAVGTIVNGQFWWNQAGPPIGLSDAIEFMICP